MKILLTVLCLLFGTVYGQTIGYMRYDTVKIFTTKVGGRGSLDVTGNVRFTGLLPMVGATDSVVVRDVNGNLGTTAKGAFGATIPISSLLAATATNSINNANFGQTWSWDDLDGTGLFVFANATEADNNNQILFGATLLGANANASQTTATAAFSNVHTGTSSTNIALALTASGGSTNIGLQVGRGSTNLGTVGTENGVLKFNGLTSGTVTVQPQDAAGTWTFKWPTTDGAPNEFLQTDGNGVATWAAPSGGGLTVGTTTIASGTDTRVLYNNAGVLGEYTLTGTGTVVTMQTAPTFITSATVPLLLGSTAANGDITINGTSSGTKTTSYVNIQDGGGLVGIGIATPLFKLDVKGTGTEEHINIQGSGTGSIKIGTVGGSGEFGAMWAAQASPTVSNYAFLGNASFSIFNVPSGGSVRFRVNNADQMIIDASGNVEVATLAGATNGRSVVASTTGVLSPGPIISSGTYTPTLFNVTNITASTPYDCQYLRVGNTVTVSGKVDIDVTLGAASELGMSLPIASAITAEENLGGTGSSAAAASLVSAIRADVANDRAAFVFTAISLTNDSYFFEFTYQIK